MRRPRILVLGGSASCLALAACSAIIGLDAPPSGDAGATSGSDATTSDSSPGVDVEVDAELEAEGDSPAQGDDGGPITCTPLDGGDGGPYSPFDGSWEIFDSSLVPSYNSSADFAGGTFDGRYVYYASQSHFVVRFDTTGSFGDPSAWSVAKLPVLDGASQAYGGAVFDGRYVILVPALVSGQSAAVATRFDTALEGDFTATSSVAWQHFDLSTLSAEGGGPTSGYFGGVFDGRYVYFVPRNDGAGPFGRVARFDTAGSLDAAVPDGALQDATAEAGDGGGDSGDAGDSGARPSGFADPAMWSTFDMSGVNAAATGYVGGVFAAGSVYFAPEFNDFLDAEVNNGTNAIVVRFLPDAGFTTGGAWTTFDATRIHGRAGGYLGGAFDGRYVYFVPKGSGLAMRYDTQATFGSTSAWSVYDTTRTLQLDGSSLRFFGGAFDGRFVYFIPNDNGSTIALRYDTLSSFDAPCAWSTFDVGQLAVPDAGSVSRFIGAVFDGQFVYLVPNGPTGTAFVRFAARAPGPLPGIPDFHGSFL